LEDQNDLVWTTARCNDDDDDDGLLPASVFRNNERNGVCVGVCVGEVECPACMCARLMYFPYLCVYVCVCARV